MAATTQAEAPGPATLARIVEEGIVSRIDLEVYRQGVKREQEEREQLLEMFRGAS